MVPALARRFRLIKLPVDPFLLALVLAMAALTRLFPGAAMLEEPKVEEAGVQVAQEVVVDE